MPDGTVLEAEPQLREDARRVLGVDDIGPLSPLAGGASRELLGFDAGEHELVLLRQPAALGDVERMEREWEALTAAHRAGVPVAEPLWRTPDHLGIVMRRLVGEAIPRKVLRDQLGNEGNDELLASLAAAAAATHRVAPDELPHFDVPTVSASLDQVQWMEYELDRLGEPHPPLEAALRWLRANLPVDRPLCLVHGDMRLGNLMIRDARLVAVLDWELTHLGSPVDDLGYMCIRSWRFGADDRPAAGFGSRERLLEHYAAAGGAEISLDELRWWEILGNVKWAVFCVRQADRHLSGAMHSQEHAAIGRRTCEPTWDALELISR